MKKIYCWMLLIALLLPTLALSEAIDREGQARTLVEQVFADDVDAYYDTLSPAVQAQLPRETLETLGAQLMGKAGAFVGFGEGAYIASGTVVLPLEMDVANLLAQVSIDDAGMVTGFAFVFDTGVKADTSMREDEEAVAVGPHALAGVLTLPEADEKVPAVVLVHGSGPNDRNEQVGDVAIFRDIAYGLAARGIAVLRYDKRTYAMQQGTLPYTDEDIANLTAYEETIEDAIAAAELLRADERIDHERVYILGHSMGGMLATRMQDEGADANGLIILAGTLRHLTDLIVDQLSALDEAAYAEEIATARALPAMTEAEAREHTLLGSPAYGMWEAAQHDTVALAEKTDVPMLILQGTEDQNVYADIDYALWEAYAGEHPAQDITLKRYDGLGHLFDVDGAFSADVLADIAAWIAER